MRIARSKLRTSFAVVCLISFAGSASAASTAELRVGIGERLLVVAPHPDDETLGAGGLIQRVVGRGGVVRVIFVTTGDGEIGIVAKQNTIDETHRKFLEFGRRRSEEGRSAVDLLAGDAGRVQVLGFPDGGLASILDTHWRATTPVTSSTTGACAVPYPNALRQNAPYAGEELERQIASVIGEFEPTILVIPHPLDRHPDHAVTGKMVLLALKASDRERVDSRVLAYLIHWPDWPAGWNGVGPRNATLDLPADFDAMRSDLWLSASEVVVKDAALAQHVTQMVAMPEYLNAFIRSNEPFVVIATDSAKPQCRGHVGCLAK